MGNWGHGNWWELVGNWGNWGHPLKWGNWGQTLNCELHTRNSIIYRRLSL